MLATLPEGAQSVRVMIPSDKVSFVIGTKGAVIHDIQRNSGAIVQVERRILKIQMLFCEV